MMAEKDIISLIVKSDNFASLELWIIMENGCKHSTHRVSQPCGHVVDNNFWSTVVVLCSIL